MFYTGTVQVKIVHMLYVLNFVSLAHSFRGYLPNLHFISLFSVYEDDLVRIR